MLNSVIMTGRMVADPELRTTQSGVNVTSFRIAVRETVEIIADSVYFGEKKRDTSEQNTAPVPDDFEPIEDEFPDFPA